MATMMALETDACDALLNSNSLVERCMGNLDLVQRLLSRFADSGRQDCEHLEAALRAGDLRTLASVAHRLKGNSATIGAERMARLASRIERESKSAGAANLDSVLNSLVAEIRAVQVEVSQRCHESLDAFQNLGANGGGE
ncbi:Hpt domain-containing protein [Candidatus Laterigemmans baculatus]|uniref:Hpt domain-containing protein n=1 Tax=Candidatus Laterigemmans baculatus TaxID=2770505 RepID=UPI0013DA9FAC|nr:Hpt domain-containing protein [Candidatus Laterigemmans baculatus]